MSFFIREMQIYDCEKIKDNLQEDFDEFWNYNILKQELETSNSKYIVAIQNDEILGFAGIKYNFDYVEIMNIVVKKQFRKNGIATKLLNELISISKEYNVKKIGLEVNEKNVNAIKLYEKLGFKEIGRRIKYYNGKDSAILMDYYL